LNSEHENRRAAIPEGPLNWTYPVAAIPERGIDRQRTATAGECAAVAAALAILGCSRIDVHYRIRPAGAGCYRVSGMLTADVVQACVVSTDPVAQQVRCEFEALFRPPSSASRPVGRDEIVDPFEAENLESIENGAIDVGRVVYEEIASGLDPYPRIEGISLEWSGDVEDGPSRPVDRASPFAKLAALKKAWPNGQQ
jgi:hypothetical protein